MPTGEITFSVVKSPEGGYEARAIGHAIFTQADSLKELKTMIRNAVACHFTKQSRPRVIHFSCRQRIA